MSGYILYLSILHSHVFLLNSRLGLFSAAHLLSERPLFRSYRTILPSSLTANHSSALVYSTQPPVSVCGTGNHAICLADFLGSSVTLSISPRASTQCTVRFSSRGGFAYPNQRLHPSTSYSVSWQNRHISVSTSLT